MKTIPLRVQSPPPSPPPPASHPAPPAWRLLAAVPHRLFFAAAMLVLVVSALVWAWALVARTGVAGMPPLGPAQPVWHLLAMLFGSFAFYMFGFLFTAGPRWLDVPPPAAAQWRPAGVAALLGALAMLLAPTEPLARAGAAAYGFAWLVLDVAFARLLVASRARDKVHASLVLAAMLAGASGPLAYAAFAVDAYPWLAYAGMWLYAIPVFVVVCHRMIPFFTASVLPAMAIFRPWWLLAVLLGGPLVHGALEFAGAQAWTWIVDLPLAVFALDLARRWGLAQSMANRLLAMLHVGFAWYAISFALYASSSLAALLAGTSLGHAPVHALALGFCGSLMIAMVSRVTFGHSGRALAADRFTWSLFVLLQAAAVARVGASLWPHPAAMAAGALLWAAVVVPWALRFLPIYWRARADGKPG
ncbi:MAG: NnrS family protein [Betaproteobacteria bacterium]|nr:NnrS family protein [Betaproteobacteria bacterium]MDH5287129.1 NnrS family protein [Betaproteobacteria bacterium]